MISFEKKRIYLLIIIFVSITFFSVAISVYAMYVAALDENRLRLTELAQNQARMIEAVSRFDEEHFATHSLSRELAWNASLGQFKEAHQNYQGFGESGEFTLAKKVDDQIIFLTLPPP